MQIIIRHNKVIDYCEEGYLCMGATAICESKGVAFDACTIATVADLPSDINDYDYFYINGKFVKEGLKSANNQHNHNDIYFSKQETEKLVEDAVANIDIPEVDMNGYATEEFVLEHGVKTIEASNDNVIDFNTLTEPGYYLIKNCGDGAGTTINSGLYTDSPQIYVDVMLEIRHIVNNGTRSIYQIRKFSSATWANIRYLKDNVWSEWTTPKLSADKINGGTLAGQVKANSSAVATLGTGQVRNITLSTTDLEAGTSPLADGEIYFVYE